VITYVSENGLIKTERFPAKVMFDCTPYSVTQSNLANQCLVVRIVRSVLLLLVIIH